MKKHLLLLVSLLFSIGLFSQSHHTIKGTVFDNDGEPIPGSYVVQKGTTNGTVTDIDGNFSLSLPFDEKGEATLTISFIGYIQQDVKIKKSESSKFLKIVLQDDVRTLDEVVVVAYGTTKRRDMVGSVVTVGSGKKKKEKKEKKPKSTPVASPRISEDAISSDYSDYSTSTTSTYSARVLTAGEVNDFSKWALWDDIVNKSHASYASKWKMKPLKRYVVQLSNSHNMPIADAVVRLEDNMGGVFWATRSDNTGKAELWANMYEDTAKSDYKIVCEYKGKKEEQKEAVEFEKGINTIKIDNECNADNRADVMFIVDATGSMGDEIRYLQAELTDVMARIKESQPHLAIRMGSVFYRDHGDAYLTRTSQLDADISKTISFMKEQSASGGGDTPEAMEVALGEAFTNGGWHDAALARVAFLVLDAPCHNDAASLDRLQTQVMLAAQKGIRIVPIICSGMQQDGEYLMRAMALATNGTSLFLTDDSGIGGTHLKPTTDKMEVEMLNDMLVRLLIQYTKMPNCQNDVWEKEEQKEADMDKFVPDPYDEPEVETLSEKTEKTEEPKEEKSEEILNPIDVILSYPNPCSDVLRVKAKKELNDLFFIDISGKSLERFKKIEADNEVTINVNRYAAGIYFVKAYHNGKWYAQKVIVKGH